MANNTKERSVPQSTESSVIQLAERLFVNAWNASSGYTVESLAEKCLDAAEEFDRVRRERS